MTETELVPRIYSNFRGVDFRGEEINLVRSPDSLNVWKDRRHTESIRTRPAMELVGAFTEAVYGVFFYKANDTDIMLIHSGTQLFRVVNGEKSVLYTGLNTAKSDSFIYNNFWYFKDGKNYLQYDGKTIKPVEAYVPTTSIGRKPSGGGTVHEDVNLLTGRRINTFLGEGAGASSTSVSYYLDAKNIDTDFEPIVKVNGVVLKPTFEEYWYTDEDTGEDVYRTIDRYTVNYSGGYIQFGGYWRAEGKWISFAPPKPSTEGQDNVSIEFRKTVDGYNDRIHKCTLLQVFDNRVFFSGNKDFPNMLWHCSLNDPTYCSDLDYYNEGLDTATIKGMVAGNNALWVFKEPSQANTSIFYHTPTNDLDYGKIYPNTHSSIAIGCIGKAINFNDDIVFFSNRGMEGISGDITTEQVVAHRSSLVDRKLIAESNYADMVLEEWEGYLVIFIDNKVYLADSRATYTNENHIEYEFFHWQLDKDVLSAKVHNGILYVGTSDGVYSFTDTESDVESWWTTPLDKFKYPHRQKTTNKKGCVVEATGSEIELSVKTNNDNDWQSVGVFENVTDAFTCKIKKKKFKDIKLKFYSKKRFSLESATLECFVGGYLKRV